jgi:cobyrinic acid a,c-diamide synthase
MPVIHNRIRRLVIAGLRGSSGKTILSLGLAGEWSRRGLRVAPFKKGPDYIDAHWLSLATGKECRNLDVLLCGPDNVIRYFIEGSRGADIAVIEGNRGIYDGLDETGTYSTA